MAIRREFWLAATVTATLLMSSKAGAREPERHQESASTTSEHKQATGIVLDRLTRSQRKTWGSIMGIVLAQDKQGRPLHPKLYRLYHQAATSGHAIFVELSTESFSYRSLGGCRVESQAAGTQKAAIVMRLNLGMIGRACINERNRRADGFIPFAGLGKKERYAEVLGHELTHAVLLLLDADYLGLYQERKARVYSSSQNGQLIDSLSSLIEGPAEAAEKETWAELKAGRRSKAQFKNNHHVVFAGHSKPELPICGAISASAGSECSPQLSIAKYGLRFSH